MAEATIDELVIEVSSDAAKAARGFDKLVSSLSKLESGVQAPIASIERLHDKVNKLLSSVNSLNVQSLLQLSKIKVADGLGTGLSNLADGLNSIPADAEAKIASLSGLTVLKGLSGSRKLAENIASLSSAIASVPGDAYVRLSGLTVLTRLGEVKISSTLPKNIRAIGEAVQSLPESTAERLRAVADAVSGFKELDGVKITTAVNGIKKLPEAMRNFEGLDIDLFTEAMAKLNTQLGPMAKNIRELADSINQLPPSFRTAGKSAGTVTSANKQLARQLDATGKKADTLGDRLKRLFNTAAVIAALRTVVSKLGEAVNAVSDYVEDMNLYAASMGEFAKAGAKFAMDVQTKMGIDSGEWMRFQGVLQSIGTGFGIAGDRMATMSQNMTQLGYDLASFYNLDIDEAMRKVQSGFAGELEPMRRIGYDLSVARMEIEAANLGIEKQVSDMSQAEKAALRYHLMMTQLTQTHGDMARTINSPANQLRVLRAQLTLAARAIGNIFIPLLNAILPYAIAAAKAIRMLAQTIADFFGIKANFDVDYSGLDTSGIGSGIDTSGIDDIGDSAEDAGDAVEETKKKVDELKNSVMGFDELNKLVDNTPSDSDSGSGGKPAKVGGGGVGGSVLDQIPMETYDFMKGLDDYLSEVTDKLAEKFQKLLPLIAAIAGGLAAWKIADTLLPDTLKGIDRFRKLLGVAMAVAGAIVYLHGVWDAWVNGMNLDNLLQMLIGMTGVVVGLGLAFGRVGAAIGLLVTGLGLFVTSIHDAVVNGCNWFNVLGATIGSIAMVVGSFLLGLTGVVTALIGIVAGAIMVVVGFMDAWNNGLDWENLAMMIGGTLVAAFAAFMGGLGPVGIAIAGIVGGIAMLVAGLKDMWENGFSPENFAATELGFTVLGVAIGALFGPVGALVGGIIGAVVGLIATLMVDFDGFAAWLSELWNGIVEATRFIWEPVATWFNDNVIQPIAAFFAGIGPFFENLWNSIVTGISTWWGGVAQWINDNVIQPIVNFWTPIIDWWSQLLGSLKATNDAIWHNIGEFVKGIWMIIQRAWEVASGWFDQNVLQPISNFFTEKWEAIQNVVGNAWEAVKNKWGEAWGWFDQNVIQPIVQGFTNAWNDAVTKAQEAWNGITSAFSRFGEFFGGIVSGAWERIKAAFQYGGQIFEGVVDAIINAFKWAVNQLIDGLNWAISQPFEGLNSIIRAMRDWEILDIRPFAGFWEVPVPQIPHLASGGQVTSGQLFVARENGLTEMVGQMGGKTTVANNQQIVEGISQGVANAMFRVIATQRASEGGETVIEIPLFIGREELSRAVYKGDLGNVRRGVINPVFV